MSQLLMQKQTVKEYVIQYSACEGRWMLSAWYTHTFLNRKCEIKQVALRATELMKTFFLQLCVSWLGSSSSWEGVNAVKEALLGRDNSEGFLLAELWGVIKSWPHTTNSPSGQTEVLLVSCTQTLISRNPFFLKAPVSESWKDLELYWVGWEYKGVCTKTITGFISLFAVFQ